MGEIMKVFVRGSLGVCVALSSCASVPKLPTEVGLLRISDIVDNIRCDLKDGRDGRPKAKPPIGPATFLTDKGKWNAAVELSLNVVATGGGDGSAGNEVPYIPQTGTFALATNATGTADRMVGYKFTIGLGQKDDIKCDTPTVNERRAHGSRLTGNLGIANWLAQVQDSYADTKTPPDSVSYVMGFTLDEGASASVKIITIPFDTGQASLGIGWKTTWKDVNKISIVFAPKPEEKPKAAPAPARATKLPEGQHEKNPPAPPPVDPAAKEKLLNDLNLLLLQKSLGQ
ncbi:hypothetical protein NKI77_14050 [Mesorhizobium opportunistum]|uniref:hypothetical protein n=2 Tax=Phyllobacteriaceae TaxID=69277 RepID=UPI0003CEF229|nr:hypothetical protein [Mesorhizobium sp. LNJC384A00]ESY39648.1 hypothetical protein X747_22825 [Mesorhizobium sp. LNJC384A00]